MSNEKDRIKPYLAHIESEYNAVVAENNLLKDQIKRLPIKFFRWVIIKGYEYNPKLSNGPVMIFNHRFKQQENIDSLYRDFCIESNIKKDPLP